MGAGCQNNNSGGAFGTSDDGGGKFLRKAMPRLLHASASSSVWMYVASRLSILVVAVATAALAQSPAFDVVSIKPSAPDAHNSFSFRTFPGGTIRMAGVPLRMMIMSAYGVKAFQLSGGPDWVRTVRWDVVAKADGFQDRIPRDQENLMIQAMMADRFQLKVHTEMKEMPVYAPEVDKNGSKLVPHSDRDTDR